MEKKQQQLFNNPDVGSSRPNIYFETPKRNGALEFEGYQDLEFRPLYPCDRFDPSLRHCVLFRQLGTTLTLGVKLGDGTFQRGVRVRWYRYLKKQQSDHYIRETLKRDFLPWNLNLGGSANELRLSPITDTDLSYNYFVAEMNTVSQSTSHPEHTYVRKPTVRFTIEPLHIDMGFLYHGEEIIIYARSFMELPQTSVTFIWNLHDSEDMNGEHGLPSNMRFNLDRSSVIIKELKTYQSQILTCSVYSNKNVFLARRNFLFRGSAKENSSAVIDKTNTNRSKRSIDDTENFYENSNQETYSSAKNSLTDNIEGRSDILSENFFKTVRVPEISKYYFYDDGKKQYFPEDRIPRSDRISYYSQYSNTITHPSQEMLEFNSLSDHESPTMEEEVVRPRPELLKFEDKESQTIATCSSTHDCNVHAFCARSTFSGQKFCKCPHGYNGNGIFCFSN